MPQDTDPLSPARIEEARSFVWTTSEGERIRLGDMHGDHLKNLEKFLGRRLESLHDRQEQIELDHLDPQVPLGMFTGLEEPIERLETALGHVRVEALRRTRADVPA